MQNSSPALWPRGLLVGALLAMGLIVPVFVVMAIDSAAGTARRPAQAAGRFALFQRPLQLRGSSGFFDGRLAVQAVISQRFAPTLPPDAASAAGDRPDFAPSQRPLEAARDNLVRLRLENLSEENVAVDIVGVNTPLGAFVARPDRVTLAPGQTVNIDSPVHGQQLTTASVPVEVALRVGGSVETKKLVLRDRVLAQVER